MIKPKIGCEAQHALQTDAGGIQVTVSQITKLLAIAAIVFAVLIAAVGIVRLIRRKKENGKTKKLGTVILCVLLAVLCAVNVAVNQFSNIINQVFSSVQVDEVAVEDAAAPARAISQRFAEEGIVLLENKHGALPLTEKKVNLFGMASISPVYGGAGSGASDESGNISLIQGIESAGFSVNADLTAFYQERKPKAEDTNIFNLQGGDYNLPEPAVSEYSQALLDSAKQFSDVAVVVFARAGGEGGDLPTDMEKYTGGDPGQHYLKLQTVERAMLDMVIENFGTVIVLINSSNAMELGFLEEEGISAALWIGGPGSTGCAAVGEILAGTVNPSGRLPDIYAYDVTTSPAYWNAGNFYYTNAETGKKTTYKYLEYAEGIYVGYRFYETAAADGYFDYDSTVQYPFGYGLSYTSFSQELVSHKEENGVITCQVKITNTGKTAGKEVAQLYVTAPYTPGGIEKAHVVLAAFGKTRLLEAGASEILTLSFRLEDIASYDAQNAGAYVLEAGDYEIKLQRNSHEVIDSFTWKQAQTVVYSGENKRSTDQIAAENRFSDAAGDVRYVSRADWAGTLPRERVGSKPASAELQALLDYKNATDLYCGSDPAAETPVTGANNGLKLEDMKGLSYDDPQWEKLLDQLTVEDMAHLIGYGGFATAEAPSVGKAVTIDIDGPAGLNSLTSDISGVQYPSETLIAATFNQELAEEMGQVYAAEAHAHGVNGLYAPAANIHRTPFSGRNFEYYSEDPVLSGKMGAATVRGIHSLGICTYVKHFALNDQETNRSGVAVWSNEQAIREIYLKAFEIIVKEGKTDAIMSSYNRIGAVWAGGNEALLNGVLRGEWGFIGCVVTDYANGKYMIPDQAIRAGGDMMLSTLGHVPTEVSTGSSYGLQQMRRASKNILYTVANSRAYVTPVVMSSPTWLYLLIALNVVLFAGIAALMLRFTGKKSQEKAKSRIHN